MIQKTVAALTALLLLGVVTANTAGALGRPWWCGLHSWADGACRVGETANDARKTVEDVGRGAGATVEAGQQGTRVVVNGTELAGTVLGKTADAVAWANERAKQARIPTRTLRPGQCVDTLSGRYCRPVPEPTPRLSVGHCVIDSHGRKWCVTR